MSKALLDLPIDILYQDVCTLVVQTHAGVFDKFASDDLYGQFNMGLHVQDNPSQVLKNRAILLSWLYQQSSHHIHSIHWLTQIHSNQVHEADELMMTPVCADALVSDDKGMALAIMTADCVPIVLLGDGGVACIHAGWQGLANGVIYHTIQQLTLQGVTILQALIGACISQQHYEMDTKLALNIVTQVCQQSWIESDVQALYQQIVKAGNSHDKCQLDIVALSRWQLQKLGVTIINDDVPCSYANADLYSYRAQTHAKKHATGRMATVVARW